MKNDLKSKCPAIIVDLDGTLANIDERRANLINTNDWDLFHSKIPDDKLNFWCREIIEKFRLEYKIILVTGRKESCRSDTIQWLKHYQVHYDYIYFRKDNDFRTDVLVKEEIYNESILDHFSVLFVVDDRKSVVQMWRTFGLTCLQCDYGDF
jgi:hypothetical protein